MSKVNNVNNVNVTICNCCKKPIKNKPTWNRNQCESHQEIKLFGKSYHAKYYEQIIIIKSKCNLYENKEIDVTYEKIKDSHDGYCSDTSDEETIITTIVRTYPLHLTFNYENKSSDLDLSLYNKENRQCKPGSGYCDKTY
jgi:hypothetical protein